MKHSTMKRRPKVILARRLRSNSDIKHGTSIFQTKGWHLRAQAKKFKAMPKKHKQEMVDTFVRKVGIKSILKKFRPNSDK